MSSLSFHPASTRRWRRISQRGFRRLRTFCDQNQSPQHQEVTLRAIALLEQRIEQTDSHANLEDLKEAVYRTAYWKERVLDEVGHWRKLRALSSLFSRKGDAAEALAWWEALVANYPHRIPRPGYLELFMEKNCGRSEH